MITTYPTEPWRWRRTRWQGCQTGGSPLPYHRLSWGSSNHRTCHTGDTWWRHSAGHTSLCCSRERLLGQVEIKRDLPQANHPKNISHFQIHRWADQLPKRGVLKTLELDSLPWEHYSCIFVNEVGRPLLRYRSPVTRTVLTENQGA